MSLAATGKPTDKPASGSRKVHCATDDWDFDPRYTGGVCPICGWQPPTAAGAAGQAARMVWLASLDWEIIGLVALAAVLVIMGVLVGIAAGISLVPK